jgi:hypothetical protein
MNDVHEFEHNQSLDTSQDTIVIDEEKMQEQESPKVVQVPPYDKIMQYIEQELDVVKKSHLFTATSAKIHGYMVPDPTQKNKEHPMLFLLIRAIVASMLHATHRPVRNIISVKKRKVSSSSASSSSSSASSSSSSSSASSLILSPTSVFASKREADTDHDNITSRRTSSSSSSSRVVLPKANHIRLLLKVMGQCRHKVFEYVGDYNQIFAFILLLLMDYCRLNLHPQDEISSAHYTDLLPTRQVMSNMAEVVGAPNVSKDMERFIPMKFYFFSLLTRFYQAKHCGFCWQTGTTCEIWEAGVVCWPCAIANCYVVESSELTSHIRQHYPTLSILPASKSVREFLCSTIRGGNIMSGRFYNRVHVNECLQALSEGKTFDHIKTMRQKKKITTSNTLTIAPWTKFLCHSGQPKFQTEPSPTKKLKLEHASSLSSSSSWLSSSSSIVARDSSQESQVSSMVSYDAPMSNYCHQLYTQQTTTLNTILDARVTILKSMLTIKDAVNNLEKLREQININQWGNCFHCNQPFLEFPYMCLGKDKAHVPLAMHVQCVKDFQAMLKENQWHLSKKNDVLCPLCGPQE